MDPRRVEYQLRLIEITYRAQQAHGELGSFRQRAYQILDGLITEVDGDQVLMAEVNRVREEVSRGGPSGR